VGYSQADKARSRERILDAAARQISEHGLDSVSVADSMQSAGLTKGAFYAHFASREAMIAEAADRVMQHGQARIDHLFRVKKKPTVAQIADVWLDPERDGTAIQLLEQYHIDDRKLPAVLFPDGSSLVQPSQTELAGRVGLRHARPVSRRGRDVETMRLRRGCR